jgi:hypothetical protein
MCLDPMDLDTVRDSILSRVPDRGQDMDWVLGSTLALGTEREPAAPLVDKADTVDKAGTAGREDMGSHYHS